MTVKVVPTFVLNDMTPGGGIVMPEPFQYSFALNSFVTLTAMPADGWTFLDWKGNTQGTNPVATLQVTYAKTLRARFGTTITVTPSGSGNVSIIPSSELYPYGTTVRIVAGPQPGNYFAGWSGSANGVANPLTMVVRDANPVVFGWFYTLPVGRVALTLIPDEYGEVSVMPHANTFTTGQTVTNQAIPDAGQEFLGWTGDASGTNNPLVVTMNQSKVITASFTKRPRMDIMPLNIDEFLLTLTGEFTGAYRILSSTNLTNWVPYVNLTNAYGEAQIIDPPSTNQYLFYRAMAINTNAPTPGPRFVWLPAGQFVMGSPSNETDRNSDEGPQTQVTISKGFWMSKCEVTQEEYQAMMGDNPSYFTGDLMRPVEQVSWVAATNYCGKLTQQERSAGRLPAGYVYRLPTEAEWEYACRAGTTTRFSYGDDLDYSLLKNYGWYWDNSYTTVKPSGVSFESSGRYYTTQPAGQKLPIAWGSYDMHGNVWEWCLDWYGAYPGGSVTDPRGPNTGSARVYRGGSWDLNGRLCRTAGR